MEHEASRFLIYEKGIAMEKRRYVLDGGQTTVRMPRQENEEFLREVWFNSTFDCPLLNSPVWCVTKGTTFLFNSAFMTPLP